MLCGVAETHMHSGCVMNLCACPCRLNYVIVHVGCLSLGDSQELVSHCFYIIFNNVDAYH